MLWVILAVVGAVSTDTDKNRVIDGDTIVYDGTTYRFACIDAPELDTWQGERTKEQVEQMLGGMNDIRIKQGYDPYKQEPTGKYGRTLAYIYKDGTNINRYLVEHGYAKLYEGCDSNDL